MKYCKVILLAGIFPDSQAEYIEHNSIGPMQNAADAFQKKLIEGLDQLLPNGLHVINLPFVGSYPKFFKSPYFPRTKQCINTSTTLEGHAFLTIRPLKIFSRFLSAFYSLMRTAPKDDTVLFVYSAHLPFVIASSLVRLINPSLKICLIIPDLPEFMGDGGRFYTFLKRLDSSIFYSVAKNFDYFIVLTKHMIEKMKVDPRKALVIEGIATPYSKSNQASHAVNPSTKVLLYTGTLALRYGVKQLIDAFQLVQLKNKELWICGDGDGREYIEAASRADFRIKYFGQVTREKAMALQNSASALINPRPPEGEYTKYSFPSKIMEYMASGRPVIMYKLAGMPDEYDPFYISPKTVGVNGLADCIEQVLHMNDAELSAFGKKARSFVLSTKNPLEQVKKILNFIKEND